MAKKSEEESKKSKKSKKKILATAAGVAAATAAGVVAARKIKQSKTEDLKVYHVLPADDGWSVKAQHEGNPHSTHATKKEALEAAREVVRGQGPTQLIIHRKDGSLQDSHRYGEKGS